MRRLVAAWLAIACAEGATVAGRSGLEVAPAAFVDLKVSNAHTCLILQDQSAWCFGGANPRVSEAPPTGPLAELALGPWQGCARRPEGSWTCFGAQGEGRQRLGRASLEGVALGGLHGCGLREDATPWCWGDDSYGQRSAPPTPLRRLRAGLRGTCGIDVDGAARCWGRVALLEGGPWEDLAVGDRATCGRDAGGQVRCSVAGDWSWGQPPSDTGWIGLTGGATWSGAERYCAWKANGEAACWGRGEPAAPPPGERFARLAVGGRSSCGITQDGRALCWDGGHLPLGGVVQPEGPGAGRGGG